MYVQHFGLKKRPFRANATGTDVFVGPQTVTAIAGLKTALQSNDSVVAVYGPVGVGKSTLVTRALEAVGENRIIIRVSRMRLNSDDVLEHLLAELGADEIPGGTIRRFTEFRKRLKSLEAAQTRVFVVVEDAPRLGADTLAEVEAVTAEDAGESDGASLILMGDESIDDVLGAAALERLKQRTRQKYLLTPLRAAELRGYLRHCFRLAGAEFEKIFEEDAANLLHYLGDGVLRTTNKLVEAVLAAAAAQNMTRVPSDLIRRVAAKEFGLNADGFSYTPPVVTPPVERAAAPQPVSEPKPVAAPELDRTPEPVAAPEPELIPEPVADAEPLPEPGSAATAEPVVVFAEESADEEEREIPELVQDTLPDLEVLVPDLAKAMAEPAASDDTEVPAPEPVGEAPLLEEPFVFEPAAEPTLDPGAVDETPEANALMDDIPELSITDDSAAGESNGADVAAWDRDPTFAELKPDLEALEKAMAVAHGGEPEPPVLQVEPEPAPDSETMPEAIPEITLDHAISQRIQENLIDEPGQVSASEPPTEVASKSDTPEVRMPERNSKKADAELEKIAEELAKAKSIEDVDDKLAETLFGEELSFVAAQVVTNPPSTESANDENEPAIPTGQVVAEANGSAALDVAVEAELPAVEVTLSGHDEDKDVDPLSASQRLKTVRALNADLHPSIREPEQPVATNAAVEVDPVDSIEDQINTSMTQTLKALNIRPPLSNDPSDSDDDDDEESKGGFFSRFRRS